ncbi:hypothetical protein GR925_15260 [Streptomyces sp. HUCO-GS316]|nr:hypothetical protein [Streptomyces sp. HUCO-GS316]MXM64767.1 hypothetical protein [Streptomyces sp. HUCO-GS316]
MPPVQHPPLTDLLKQVAHRGGPEPQNVLTGEGGRRTAPPAASADRDQSAVHSQPPRIIENGHVLGAAQRFQRTGPRHGIGVRRAVAGQLPQLELLDGLTGERGPQYPAGGDLTSLAAPGGEPQRRVEERDTPHGSDKVLLRSQGHRAQYRHVVGRSVDSGIGRVAQLALPADTKRHILGGRPTDAAAPDPITGRGLRRRGCRDRRQLGQLRGDPVPVEGRRIVTGRPQLGDEFTVRAVPGTVRGLEDVQYLGQSPHAADVLGRYIGATPSDAAHRPLRADRARLRLLKA